MKIDFDKVQEAFVDGRISIEDLFEILVDNFGHKKAKKIIMRNLELAREIEVKEQMQVLKELEKCQALPIEFHLPRQTQSLACVLDSHCRYMKKELA